MNHRLTRLAAACFLSGSLTTMNANAQLAVIDIPNLIQTIQQVADDITQIENQVQQIKQLQTQISSMNGMRKLGEVFDNTDLSNYVPSEAYKLINAIDANGYSGLSSTAKSLRDSSMIYNCTDFGGASRTDCQARLAQPYQQKGMLQDAMTSASGRLTQIRSLMRQINTTDDQKSIQEIQARIGAENALLGHEMSQIQMLQGMADSEERIARSRDQESQYQTLGRTGKIADFVH